MTARTVITGLCRRVDNSVRSVTGTRDLYGNVLAAWC